MGGRKAGDYPRSLPEFFRRFPTDEACLRYLVETRWPDGFRCPACDSDRATFMVARRLWPCRDCRRQSSATAGTVLHRSHLPLTDWFAAAFLMTSHKPGISALQLQHLLGLGSFGTAWTMLHKFRRAMVNPDRTPLSGEVEVDATWVGGKQAGLKGGRQKKDRKALLVVVAVERHARASDACGWRSSRTRSRRPCATSSPATSRPARRSSATPGTAMAVSPASTMSTSR